MTLYYTKSIAIKLRVSDEVIAEKTMDIIADSVKVSDSIYNEICILDEKGLFDNYSADDFSFDVIEDEDWEGPKSI